MERQDRPFSGRPGASQSQAQQSKRKIPAYVQVQDVVIAGQPPQYAGRAGRIVDPVALLPPMARQVHHVAAGPARQKEIPNRNNIALHPAVRRRIRAQLKNAHHVPWTVKTSRSTGTEA